MVCLNGWHCHVPLRDVSANSVGKRALTPSLRVTLLEVEKRILINSFLNVMDIELAACRLGQWQSSNAIDKCTRLDGAEKSS